MNRVKWTEVKGKKILYSDYSGLKTTEELLSVLGEAVKTAQMSPTKALSLLNFTDAALSTEFMDAAKKAGKEVMDEKFEKTAILGITPIKLILFKSYLAFTGAKTTKAFSTEAEAMDYLVS